MRFRTEFYTDSAARRVVANDIRNVRRQSRTAHASVLTGLQLLEEHGLAERSNRFKRLRRTKGRPALGDQSHGSAGVQSPVRTAPGGDRFVILSVVPKA